LILKGLQSSTSTRSNLTFIPFAILRITQLIYHSLLSPSFPRPWNISARLESFHTSAFLCLVSSIVQSKECLRKRQSKRPAASARPTGRGHKSPVPHLARNGHSTNATDVIGHGCGDAFHQSVMYQQCGLWTVALRYFYFHERANRCSQSCAWRTDSISVGLVDLPFVYTLCNLCTMTTKVR
jgi:hypothetical protein